MRSLLRGSSMASRSKRVNLFISDLLFFDANQVAEEVSRAVSNFRAAGNRLLMGEGSIKIM